MTIVDAHVHIWDVPSRYQRPIAPPDVRSDVDQLVALQDAANVAQAVVVQGSNDPYEYEYMIASARRYPERFALVGLLDPRDPNAIDYLAACPDRGLSGVRVAISGWREPDSMADERFIPVWQAAARHGVALCLHMLAHQAEQVHVVAARHGDARFVVDHMGLPLADRRPAPPLIENIAALATLPNVFVKLSAFPVLSAEPYPHLDAVRLADRLIERFGPRRVMWGTDFPYIQRQCGYTEGLRLFTENVRGVADGDLDWILGETARRVFRFI